MTPEKLLELERLARAATPGPWSNVYGECMDCHEWGAVVLSRENEDWATIEDGKYIAALNPQTCIELIEYIRHLERYKEDADRSLNLMALTIKTARADALREAKAAAASPDEGYLHGCQCRTRIQSLIDKPSAKEGGTG